MDNFEKYAKWALLVAISGLVITLLTLITQGHFIPLGSINFNKISSVGSFISGIVGSFFSIATTLLVWLTYKSQKEELTKTGDFLQKQRSENTFFNLLNILNETVYKLRTGFNGGYAVEGQESLSMLYNEAMGKPEWKDMEEIISSYNYMYDSWLHWVDPYMGIFSEIMEFIYQQEDKEQKKYMNILKNSRSNYEKYIIFYHSLVKDIELKEKLKKYNFFDESIKKGLKNLSNYDLYFQ